VTPRVCSAADVEAVVDTFTTAFFDDPLWGPAFPDPEQRTRQAAALWRLLVRSAMRYDWVWVTGAVEAAALWIPPGGTELTHEEEDGLEQYLRDACGAEVADGVLQIFGEFEKARPFEPHYYLSLLGTHDDHRGQGLGMGLLRHTLARVDEQRLPAYLESCNGVNDERYRGVGFEAYGAFTVPSGHVVTTMWRPAR
jgi:GNAT superfamily N-acetyltransferase